MSTLNDVRRPDASGEFDRHRLINRAQLRELIPVSTMTIWRWERAGVLPRRMTVGGRVYWRYREVLEAIERIASARAES